MLNVCYNSVMSLTWKRIDKKRRNERLVKFAEEHPDYTNKALGGIFHLSQSRVCRILQKFKKELLIGE